jgi:hypothetical protein
MSWASRHNLLARAVNRNLGGVPVIWGAVSGFGIFEQNSQLILDEQQISIEYAVHNLPTALFGGLKYNDAVLVDGVHYTVREPFKIGDGAYMMVSLSKQSLGSLLLEDGGYFLLEDGNRLLLES